MCIILLCTKSLYADYAAFAGDLRIVVTATSTFHPVCKIECISIPFEGFNNEPRTNNRYGQFQLGSVFKLWSTTDTAASFTYPIWSHIASVTTPHNGNIHDLGGSATGELPDATCSGAWGLGRYKLSIYIPETNERYVCILNNLDSMYGRNNWAGHNKYSSDWTFLYEESRTLNSRASLHYTPNGSDSLYQVVNTWDTLSGGFPSVEFKAWEVLYARSTPFGNTFVCKTSPFPISTTQALDTNSTPIYSIGCNLILDTVLENNSANKLYAYNTQNNYITDAYLVSGVNINKNRETFITPSQTRTYYSDTSIHFVTGIKILGNTNDNLILKNSKRLIINGVDQDEQGDKLYFQSNSKLSMRDNSDIYLAKGGTMIDSGAVYDMGTGTSINTTRKSKISFVAGREHNIGNKATIVVRDSAAFSLGANTTLIFDGSSSQLTLKPGATITMGANSKLVFKNGAKINAQNVTFNTTGGNFWEGIVLESPDGEDTIKNCTFNNAKNAVKITYPSISAMTSIINNNVFNIPSQYYGIVGNNISSSLITGNTFNGGYVQLYIRNNTAPGDEESAGLGDPPINEVKIMSNTFNGGRASMIIAGYIDNQTNIYIFGNNFTHSTTNEGFNFIGRKVSGNIKNNTFNNQSVEKNVFLYQSVVQIYGNTMKAKWNNIYAGYQGFPILAPSLTFTEALAYEGGVNKLTTYETNSDFKGNIFSETTDNQFFTNNGNNEFTTNSTGYHFYGYYGTSSNTYNSLQNCFSPTPPRSHILNFSNPNPMTVNWTNNMSCNSGLQNILSTTVVNKGQGIYDSIPVTDNIIDTIPVDYRLYGEIQENNDASSYFEVISTGKNLIDSFPTSDYLLPTLSDMYGSYLALDTFPTDVESDVLWGDFKLFLETKVASENYSSEFCDEAYNLVLSCLSNMKEQEIVLDGYEMIAMYHPNPTARLLATWDAEELENMLEGNAGGKRELSASYKRKKYLQLSKKEIERIKEINHKGIISNSLDLKKLELISEVETKKPIKEFVKDVYRNEIKKNEAKRKVSKGEKINLPQKKDYDKIEGFKYQIKSVKKEEKEKLQAEHLMLAGGYIGNSADNIIETTINYTLSQNYPNPFNPTTSIKYSLPKAGFVSIKIYDVVGRMVKELVSEVKETGNYSITFDGSQFASGVYFYRMEMNNFIDTKRMVLVK